MWKEENTQEDIKLDCNLAFTLSCLKHRTNVWNSALSWVMVQNVCSVSGKLASQPVFQWNIFMLEQLEKFFESALKAELWHAKKEWGNKLKGWRFFPCHPIIVACTWHTPLQSTQPPLRTWQNLFLMSASDDKSWRKIFLRFVKLASEVSFLIFKQRRHQRMTKLGSAGICPWAKTVAAALVWAEVWNISCELLTEQWESCSPELSQGNQTSTAGGVRKDA